MRRLDEARPTTPWRNEVPTRSAPGVQDHLRATEERDGAPVDAPRDGGIPHLRRAAEVGGCRDTVDDAVRRGAVEVGLELDGREAFLALRQMRAASIPA